MKKIGKYDVRTDLLYDPENHFWIDLKDDKAVIGMSPLIQETNGYFVAVQIQEAGTGIKKGDSFGSAEAEKHVGPLKTPLSGEILAVNASVTENPRLINTDPYGEGWLIEIALNNKDQEIESLIKGEEDIAIWFEAELKKFDEKGWIAQ